MQLQQEYQSLSVVQPINKPRAEKQLPTWAKVTDVSLEVEKKDLTYDEWASLFDLLKSRDKKRQWLIGDALILGETRFTDKWSQVLDPDEEDEKDEEGGETYRQYQQVSGRIPSGSRLPILSWGHHQAVAYLPPEIRDELLAEAVKNKWKRCVLRKAARKFQRAQEKARRERKGKVLNETLPIQSEEAQRFLDAYIEALTLIEEGIPKGLPSARMMNHAHKGHALWQRDRTIEKDCEAIVEMFRGSPGTTGIYRAGDGEIALWLQRNGYFMSDPDLEARLELMLEKGMLDLVDREESRQAGRRGSMGDVYALNVKYQAEIEEDEDLNSTRGR